MLFAKWSLSGTRDLQWGDATVSVELCFALCIALSVCTH
jgi:hypothetical protein